MSHASLSPSIFVVWKRKESLSRRNSHELSGRTRARAIFQHFSEVLRSFFNCSCFLNFVCLSTSKRRTCHFTNLFSFHPLYKHNKKWEETPWKPSTFFFPRHGFHFIFAFLPFFYFPPQNCLLSVFHLLVPLVVVVTRVYGATPESV